MSVAGFKSLGRSGKFRSTGTLFEAPDNPTADHTLLPLDGNTSITPAAGSLAFATPHTQVVDLGSPSGYGPGVIEPGATISWVHTCVPGTDCLVVITTNSANRTVSSITYNGVALTQAGTDQIGGGTYGLSFWYLLAPPIGSAYYVLVTFSASPARAWAGGINLAGVSQASPVNASTISGSKNYQVSSSVASTNAETIAADSLRVGAVDGSTAAFDALAYAATETQCVLPFYLTRFAVATQNSAQSVAAGGVMSWTLSVATVNMAVGVEFLFYHLAIPGGTSDSPTTNLAFTGQAPIVTPATATVITPPAGSLALAGAAPTALIAPTIVPTVGALTFTGQASTLGTNEFITAGALTFTGQAPSLAYTIAPPVGSLTFSGQTPTLISGTVIAPAAGALAFSGQTPTVVRGTVLTPTVGALSFAGAAVTLNYTVNLASGALTFAGQLPTLIGGIAPAAGALAFAGVVPSVSVSITPAAGALALGGQVPVQGAGVFPAAGVLAFVGDVAPIDDEFAPAPGAVAFAGYAPTATIQTGIKISPAAGALGFDLDSRSYAPQLTLRTGIAPAPPVPSVPSFPFVQYLQALSGAPQVMQQNAPYLLPEEVD